jgi:hypothetical protein
MRPRINALTLRPRSGVAALTALAALAALAVPAFASTGTPAAPVTQTITNQANASEQQNGRTDWVLKFQVQQSSAATLNVNNTATATASKCQRCAADGIAFQVVVASTQNLVTLNANNQANAASTNCVSCSTFAGAYQIVYASNTGKLTQWQSRALGLLQIQLTGLRLENLSSAQLQNKLDGYSDDAVSILNNGPNPIPVLTPAAGNTPNPAALTKNNGPFIDLFVKVKHLGS